MKRKFFEAHKRTLKKLSCLALAAMIAGTGFVAYRNTTVSDIPELVTFVDPEIATVEEDAVPLAAKKKTTKKVTTKTTTQKTKMAKKAKKTKTTTKKKTKNSSKTTSNSLQKIQTKTNVVTTIKTKTKKNSNIKTTQTKVVTTVTTTTTQLPKKQYSKPAEIKQTASASTTDTAAKAGNYSVRSVAPAADVRVLNAFEKIGCKVVVNPKVSYSGCFDARSRTITLKKLDNTVYHELGHFVEFVGGTSAVKKVIASAYSAEKGKYTAANKSYVLQSSSEYFAESFKNYCENPAALKQTRPMTYDAIVQALEATTDARVNTLLGVYKSVWK